MSTPSGDGRRGTGIYTASRVKHAKMWRQLRQAGEPIISSWIDEAAEGETHSFEELWNRVQVEVTNACCLILFAAEDDFPLKGALVEVGMALAAGVPVIVVAHVELEGRTMRPLGSWLHHGLVTRTATLSFALTLARQLSVPREDAKEREPDKTSKGLS